MEQQNREGKIMLATTRVLERPGGGHKASVEAKIGDLTITRDAGGFGRTEEEASDEAKEGFVTAVRTMLGYDGPVRFPGDAG